MSARGRMFAALLALAGLLIVGGVAGWSVPVALIVAGLLVAAWAYLVLTEVGPAEKRAPEDAG